MRNEKGFTLIELVVVIVILGILAAVAVPKFVDMQGDARVSAVSGVTGAIQSASALAHAQALVNGITTGNVTMEGTAVAVVNGYPAATAAGITTALSLDGFSVAYDASATPPTATFTPDSGGSSGCEVVYTEAASGGAADVNNTATAANCQ